MPCIASKGGHVLCYRHRRRNVSCITSRMRRQVGADCRFQWDQYTSVCNPNGRRENRKENSILSVLPIERPDPTAMVFSPGMNMRSFLACTSSSESQERVCHHQGLAEAKKLLTSVSGRYTIAVLSGPGDKLLRDKLLRVMSSCLSDLPPNRPL